MQAHLRTEAVLTSQEGMKYTIIREGLYNESWPLYFGYYDPKNDSRSSVIVAGDGLISWTSIADLGLGTAMIVTSSSSKYENKVLYLSAPKPIKLQDIAEIVSKVKGKEVSLKVVSREEYVEVYATGEEGSRKERASVEWWSSTYAALKAGECNIEDETLSELLASKGKQAKSVEDTIKEMLTR